MRRKATKSLREVLLQPAASAHSMTANALPHSQVTQAKQFMVHPALAAKIREVNGMDEPPVKKVRFQGVPSADNSSESSSMTDGPTPMASSPEQVNALVEHVHERAAMRKRSSMRSPPPPPSFEERASKTNHDDLDLMRRKLRKLEHVIKESARVELKLMNKSKKLRDRRAIMTRKYESMAHQLREMQRTRQPDGKLFQMGRLPPLLETSRRISTP